MSNYYKKKRYIDAVYWPNTHVRSSEPIDPNKPTHDQGLKNQLLTSSEHCK